MNIRGFFTKKRIIWTVLVLVIAVPITYKIIKGSDNSANTVTETVKKQDIERTVLATGQVVSSTDLELSFKSSGVVQRVNVKEGDKVKSGDILTTLDQKDQLASLTSARGSLASANANYQKVISGASSEEVTVAQVTLSNAKNVLENTKKQQQVLVDNSYKALLNGSLSAIASSANSGSVAATVSGTYNGTEQGVYKISIYATGNGLRFQVNGLESGDGIVDSSPQPIGTRGLYILFSSNSVPTNNIWTITIPNTQSPNYITYYNSYQSSIETQRSQVSSAENSVAAAQAALDLRKAQARPADVQAAQAQILSASGQVQSAVSSLENTIIRSPANGTITQVDVKVGELASALKPLMVLQDVGNLHVEANVSEANIADLKTGQVVDITFDALGSDRHFTGVVQTVNPASTVISGVVNYKVVATIDAIQEVKPGMTANMSVLIDKKPSVLAVALRAVIVRDGKKFIRVIDDTKKKTYHEVEIKTGLEADRGLVEIISGVSEGTEVVTFIKK